MKKVIVGLMLAIFLCTCVFTVAAQENGIYESAGELYEAWMRQNGVPDYISGVWSTDGGSVNLTFGLVSGEEGMRGQQEILLLVRNDATVTIEYQKFSRNYLYQIQKEIEDTYFTNANSLGLVAAGVKERENRLSLWIHADYMDSEETQEMIRKTTAQYADAVTFSYVKTYPQFVSGAVSDPTAPVLLMTNPKNQTMSFAIALALCAVVLVCYLLMQNQRRRMLAMETNGTVVAMNEKPFTRKEIEHQIREAELAPPGALDARVMRSIEPETKI